MNEFEILELVQDVKRRRSLQGESRTGFTIRWSKKLWKVWKNVLQIHHYKLRRGEKEFMFILLG